MGPLSGEGVVAALLELVDANLVAGLICSAAVGPARKLVAARNPEALNRFEFKYSVLRIAEERISRIFFLRPAGNGALGIVCVVGHSNLRRTVTPMGVEGHVALNQDLVLRLVQRTRAIFISTPPKEDLALGRGHAFSRKHVSICVLGVRAIVDGRGSARSVEIVGYLEGTLAYVVRIENNVRANLGVEVEQRVGVVALIARARRPADELHALNLSGFTKLVLIDGLAIGHAINGLR